MRMPNPNLKMLMAGLVLGLGSGLDIPRQRDDIHRGYADPDNSKPKYQGKCKGVSCDQHPMVETRKEKRKNIRKRSGFKN